MWLLIYLLAGVPAFAQLTGVSPTSGAVELVAYSDRGPFGPARRGLSVTLSGSGAVKWTNTCYGGIVTDHPSNSATLPVTLRVMYGAPGRTCDLNFVGEKGGTGRFTASTKLIPAATGIVSTDLLGNELSALGYCTKPNNSYRIHRGCLSQQSDTRPGGDFTPPAEGASYIDATYGAMVVNQGSGLTRSYVGGNQISYNRDYVVVWNGVNAVLHKIDARENSGDLIVSGPGGVCSVGSSSNIGLGTTAATATLGFCLSGDDGQQSDIRKFSFTGGKIKNLGVLHRHPAPMTSGLWGTGQAAMDGWLSHFDDDNRLCVLNWFEAKPKDTCIAGVYKIRNATLGPFPSKTTGLHYIWAGSDTPNRTTAYAFNPVTRTLTVSGRDVPIIDSPTSSVAGARWENGSCTTGVDCVVGGHHNTAHWGGEPYDCGTGRGRIQLPHYVDGGTCVKGNGWNTDTGRDIDAVGGPVYPAMSPLEEYFVGSRAPVAVTSGGNGGQGMIPAWRISRCNARGGVANCTLAHNGNLDGSGWAEGTPIYVDGLAQPAFNGRFKLLARSGVTFTYACGSCAGTTTADTGSVTRDVAVKVTRPNFEGLGGVRICRPGLGHCRTMLQPLNVSYGDGAGNFGKATGNWLGFNIGALGYQALNFPTAGQWGERVCYVTDFGQLEKLFVACAETGRRDLGLAPFDLDENTPDSCFDRHGHCLAAPTVTATGLTVEVKPTNPAFVCSVSVSTRPDFGTLTGTVGSESGGGAARNRAVSGLAANTAYWVNAKCGPAAGKIWDYAVLSIKTK